MKAISVTAAVILAIVAVCFTSTEYAKNPDLSEADWATLQPTDSFRPGITEADLERLAEAGVSRELLRRELRRGAGPMSIGGFMLMRREVSRGEYAAFLASPAGAEVRPPAGWNGRSVPADQVKLPVTGVSYGDAAAYAAWRHARLPTELEWEYAMRGSLLRDYPWGNEPRAENAVVSAKAPARVDDERYRHGDFYHASGNVAEWTSSPFVAYGGGDAAGFSESKKVIRGGSFRRGPAEARLTCRDAALPGRGADDIGFRLARDV